MAVARAWILSRSRELTRSITALAIAITLEIFPSDESSPPASDDKLLAVTYPSGVTAVTPKPEGLHSNAAE